MLFKIRKMKGIAFIISHAGPFIKEPMFTLVASKLICGYLESACLIGQSQRCLSKTKAQRYGWAIQKKKSHTHHFGLLSRTREYLRRRVTRKFGDGLFGFLCLRGRILDDFAQLR